LTYSRPPTHIKGRATLLLHYVIPRWHCTSGNASPASAYSPAWPGQHDPVQSTIWGAVWTVSCVICMIAVYCV